MTMHRLLWFVGLIWCWQELNCEEGRSFISTNESWNELKNNAIDLHNSEYVQPSGTIRTYNKVQVKPDLNDPINKSLNSINLDNSHDFFKNRRIVRSVRKLIKRNLGERYASDKNSTKTFEEAIQFLNENERRATELAHETNIAQWNYDSNLTSDNKQAMLNSNLKQAKFDLDTWKNATQFNWKQFNDSRIKRWFKSLTVFNQLAIGEQKYRELNLINADLVDIYSKAKICSFESKTDCNLELEPDLNLLLKESRNYDELKHVWAEWRNVSGKKMKQLYIRYVDLMNENARKNGFNDAGELWRESFQIENLNFEDQLEEQLKKIQPLYKLLHAYVRKRLRDFYGADRIQENGPIPAHILGNMWSQDWSQANLDILLPYPKRVKTNLSQILKQKNLTAVGIFKLGESFFKSIGIKELPEEFWRNSILEKPRDRDIVCHASAWDFSNGKDVRIKQCTRIEFEDLVTAHHELGHIFYYLAYADQPLVFRTGANPGFHEAIGDCIALSVQSPKHLKTIGLLENEDLGDNANCTSSSTEVCGVQQDEMNFLMRVALQKLAFLPFSYIIDKWRWDVFNGKIKEDQLNSEWWRLRQTYTGICPPVQRTENDFDPGSKYHVPASVPYLRYFVSHILQFQFHKYLCDAAGWKGRLSECDIYGNKEAGNRLQSTLALGSSVPWTEALKVFSNNTESKMNADYLINYFEPLTAWLKKELAGTEIGWTSNLNPNVCPNH